MGRGSRIRRVARGGAGRGAGEHRAVEARSVEEPRSRAQLRPPAGSRWQMMTLRLLVAGLLCSGCASVSTERVSAAEGAIRAAEEMGVSGVPRAAIYLQLAKR